MNSKPIKIAVVGCGRIAESHFKAIQQYPEALSLVAVCDTHEPSLQRVTETYGVKGYRDLTEMLASTDADAVVLCSPSGMHARQAIQAAKAGKHVITEKPMATRYEDARAMIDACDAANVKLFVVKQNRCHPTMQLLKQALDKNRFGRLYLANLNVFWTRPQSYYDQVSWRGTWEWDGGAFMNQASHYVDLLVYLFGPVQNVQAMMGTLARQIETEDTGILNLQWRHGMLGSMNVTMLTYPKNLESSLTILGENGTVKVGGLAMDEITHWEFANVEPEDANIQAANEATKAAYGLGHRAYYQQVIDVLQGKSELATSGREGFKSLELMIAAYRSAKSGQTVALPLEL